MAARRARQRSPSESSSPWTKTKKSRIPASRAPAGVSAPTSAVDAVVREVGDDLAHEAVFASVTSYQGSSGSR